MKEIETFVKAGQKQKLVTMLEKLEAKVQPRSLDTHGIY